MYQNGDIRDDIINLTGCNGVMGKIVKYPSGEKSEKIMIDVEGLLSTPLQLFCCLYQKIKKDFNRISNDFLTKPEMREQLDTLSIYLFKRLCRIYSRTPGFDTAKSEIMERIDSIRNTDLLIFSLFLVLSRYIEEKMILRLKAMGAYEYDNLTVTPKPANPIYDFVEDKIRRPEDVGVNIAEFTGLFRKITILEELSPRINLLRPDSRLKNTNDYLRKRISKGFKIAVSPFFAEIGFETGSLFPKWPEDQRTPFWFKRVTNIKAAEKALFALLEKCLEDEINVLILPELTIDKSLLDSLKQWLHKTNRIEVLSGRSGLLMIIAGSFHVNEKDDICNIATVLNHRGDILWTQGKHQIFSITKEDILKYPEIRETVNISLEGGYEKIRPADRFLAVDTPIGRICVCICLDFIHPDDLEAFRRSGVNLFFIPSMSPTNTQFRETAAFLGRNNLASSFMALFSFISERSDETASFRYIPSSRNAYEYAIEPKGRLLSFEFK